METNNHLAIQPYKFQTFQDIMTILDNESVGSEVRNIEQTYYTVDVSKALLNLKQVGRLLEVAYAGSKGFKCSEKVILMLADYQTLTNNSLLASSTFRQAALKALQNHNLAIVIAERKGPSDAVKVIAKCSGIAKKMAEVSGKLSKEAEDLCKMSRDALQAASQDETLSTEKKENIQAQLVSLEGKEASLKSKKEALQAQIADEKKREKELMRRADKAQQQSFTVSIISSVMDPLRKLVGAGMRAAPEFIPGLKQAKAAKDLLESITKIGHEKEDINNELGKLQGQLAVKKVELEHYQSIEANPQKMLELKQEVVRLEAEINSKSESIKYKDKALEEIKKTLDEQADNLQKQGDTVAQRRAELQKEERLVNADLAESVVKLQRLGVQTNDLERAIASLEVTVKTLGKVKTVFENTRLYWEGVARHCEELTDVENLTLYAELDTQEEFMIGLQQSILGWLTLGKISHQATLAMGEVKGYVDHIVSNPPSREEVGGIIQSATTALLTQLNSGPKIEEINNS